jgi:uncharacterized cupin superfamily protein
MFSKVNIKNLSIEETSHNSGSRQLLASKEEIKSEHFEAFTYGYLPSKEKWVMHKHEDIIEICLVVKGFGLVRDLNGYSETFEVGDRFIFPANIEHEIENTSEYTAEFYFFRIKQ